MKLRQKFPKPAWLKKPLPSGGEYQKVDSLLSAAGLKTVCREAACPNMFECFTKNTATFMILGNKCTRNCRFCNVSHAKPDIVDEREPEKLARTAAALKLEYVVITSVTRDDLADGGATHFAAVVQALKKNSPQPKIEVLIPDFKGDDRHLKIVLDSSPDVLNHNIETTFLCYRNVRPGADFYRSLNLLKKTSKMSPDIIIKSGLMVGLGEDEKGLRHAFEQLVQHNCHLLTIGQYLQPTRQHLPVIKYYSPAEFENLKQMALTAGLKKVAAGPYVRSSYQAKELYIA